jgi:hypothetical protein
MLDMNSFVKEPGGGERREEREVSRGMVEVRGGGRERGEG